MAKSYGIAFSKRWLLLLVFLFPVLSCTTIQQAIFPPTATPTPTPTPTVIPLASRDLAELALQESDLPDGYRERAMPGMIYVGGGEGSTGIARKTLVKEYSVMFMSESRSSYLNTIRVWTDEASAGAAFSDVSAFFMMEMSTVDIPRIGDASIALEYSGYIYTIIWLYNEAVIELRYEGEGTDDIGMDDLMRLARVIQARFEAE